MIVWLAIEAAIAVLLGLGVWLYRASLSWPTAGGSVTGIDIERRHDAGAGSGPYFRATFYYSFPGPDGRRLSGAWYKNFSSKADARDFATRELPVGKPVVVRFNPKNPALNDLELDSWTYTNDRPTSLNI